VRLTSQNCGLFGPIVHLQMIAMWIMVWWYLLGLTLTRLPERSGSHQYCLAVLSAEISLQRVGDWTKEWEFNLSVPVGLQEILIMPQNLTTWDLRLYFPSEEGVLWIFIALKNPFPWPGSKLRTLGPVASTLTTTSPRRLLGEGTHTYIHEDRQNGYLISLTFLGEGRLNMKVE
jgi:hypothetical protein